MAEVLMNPQQLESNVSHTEKVYRMIKYTFHLDILLMYHVMWPGTATTMITTVLQSLSNANTTLIRAVLLYLSCFNTDIG